MLIVVRHGRTAANRSGLLLGRADPPLDQMGQRQAQAVAASIGAVERVIASPLQRTRETAAAFGQSVELDDRWLELDYGEWDGTPTRDIPAETWARWRADAEFAPPGGESLLALGLRVRNACDEVLDSARHQNVVVVTHVSPIKATLAWALGVGDEVSWRTFVTPASVMRIAIGPAGPSLHGFNDRSHLAEIDD